MRAPSSPLPPRRKPFAAIRKEIVAHVLSGRLQVTGFAIYVWFHLQANHTTGIVPTTAARLAAELRLHSVTIRRELNALKRGGYIRYESATGSQKPYEITIENYHEPFEGTRGPLHEPLQGWLHERSRTPRNPEEFSPPKNKEERITDSLRVRSADATQQDKFLNEVRERLLSKAEALDQAPPALRETLEMYCLKTGREAIDPADMEGLASLDAAHTPAVIQKALTRAVERFVRRGKDPAALTLRYLWASLRHYTTRKPPDAQPTPNSPPGVTWQGW